jgi:hypothetical protein
MKTVLLIIAITAALAYITLSVWEVLTREPRCTVYVNCAKAGYREFHDIAFGQKVRCPCGAVITGCDTGRPVRLIHCETWTVRTQ